MNATDEPRRFQCPLEITAALAGRRFVLCGFDSAEERRISEQIAVLGALAIPCHERFLADCGRACDGAVIKLAGVSAPALRAAASLPTPVLVVSPSETILEGAGGAYCWPADVIDERSSDSELLVRLFRLVECHRPDEDGFSAEFRKDPLILVADDDPDMLGLVDCTLRNIGITCRTAKDGLATLRLAREIRPDLLLLDIKMPRMDGFEVLDALRRDPRLHKLPVILLTGCGDTPDVVRGAELTADEYLRKPVSPGVLLSRVKRLLVRNFRGWAEAGSKVSESARRYRTPLSGRQELRQEVGETR
ncbi:MAG TPA: response regulator [Bryobacteraceae bacterium]|nr:response regulator [Bryobacteraceae bacterium]